jgi:hypothetical protein
MSYANPLHGLDSDSEPVGADAACSLGHARPTVFGMPVTYDDSIPVGEVQITSPVGAVMAHSKGPTAMSDAQLHQLVVDHLRAAGVGDAEQQAADFVERVRTGRANTPPANDARLWGATSVALGASLSSEDRMIVARQMIAILRRLREPHRRTWAPGDELPSPPPGKMADLDWDVWMHQKAGNGCYRMSATDRRRNRGSVHDYEGVQV